MRDILNADNGAYGLGVIVATDPRRLTYERGEEVFAAGPRGQEVPGKRYDVYFTKFERTITFHGDYLEKV